MQEPIAITGIGCRFPGEVTNVTKFWQNMLAGVDAICEVPPTRWDFRKFYSTDQNKPGKTHTIQGGFLKEDTGFFDPAFFSISPREAEILDPQQRLLLETAWEAFEDAGLREDEIKGSNTSVFIGGFTFDNYLGRVTPLARDQINSFTATSSSVTLLSNRLSYVFDLKGPSVSVDTACSSTLVATHAACQSIWNGGCEMALAGGVNAMLLPETFVSMSKGKFISPHGRCKVFDESAQGYVRSEGCGILVLKPLSAARKNNDRIYALIKAIDCNQDGRTNGISSPNRKAQESLIQKVCQQAQVTLDQIGYFEAHGTGTQAGDVTETDAIHNLLTECKNPDKKLIVGSVKSQIGHCEAAAGAASLIKTALVLKHKKIPPNLHFVRPNPNINFSRIKVPTQIEDWPCENETHFASVNSFGYGGTNAHAILQEYKETDAESTSRCDLNMSSLYPITVTAKDKNALTELASRYLNLLKNNKQISLQDLSYSTTKKRSHFQYRFSAVARTHSELEQQLEHFCKGELISGTFSGVTKQKTKIAFVYTGMGPQWYAMGRELYQKEPVFKETLEAIDKIFIKLSSWSIIAELNQSEEKSRIKETEVAQPANFAIQAGLTALLKHWGIEPHGIAGHSVGEVSAAYAAGILSLEDAVLVSYVRSSLQQKTTGTGTMLAVGMALNAFNEKFTDFDADIAAINSPSSITLAGSKSELEKIASMLQAQDIFNQFLQVNIPYHSRFMEPIHDDLLHALSALKPQNEVVPVFSTVQGARSAGQTWDAAYWWNNVRGGVHFADAMSAMLNEGYNTFIEIGPHPVLSRSLKECIDERGHKEVITLSTLNRKTPEYSTFYESLASCYVHGLMKTWAHVPQACYLNLPTYPWQKQLYWKESQGAIAEKMCSRGHPFLSSRINTPGESWQVEWNDMFFPYMHDHKISDIPVFPGAGYVEAALQIGKEILKQKSFVIENIEFHKFLFDKPNSKQLLHLNFHKETNLFQFYASCITSEENSAWTKYASCRIFPDETKNENDILSEIGSDSAEIKITDFYQAMETKDIQYGPYFQALRKIWKQPAGNYVAQIEADQRVVENEVRDFSLLHPTLLDAAFQIFLIMQDTDANLKLPVSIGRISFIKSPGLKCWCQSVLSSQDEKNIVGQIQIFNAQKELCLRLEDIKFQAVESKKKEQAAGHTMSNLFYSTKWVEVQSASEQKKSTPQDILMFCSQHENINKDIENALVATGGTVTRVYRKDASDILRILDSATFTDIVYLWSFDEDISSNHCKDLVNGCLEFINLAQSLQNSQNKICIHFFTHHAQLLPGDNAVNLAAGSLWPLLETLENEKLHITCRAYDLDSSHALPLLFWNDFLSDSADKYVAYRNEKKYVNKIIKSLDEDKENSVSLERRYEIDHNATYLITGGTSGVGLEVAKWLIKKQVKQVVLVSRSGKLQENDCVTLEALAGEHTRLIVKSVDITNELQTHQLFENIDFSSAPLKGIVHSAAVLSDSLIQDLTREKLTDVVGPKVQGMIHLIKECKQKKINLDFFLNFSSVSVLVGNSGQANYIVANKFLESYGELCHLEGIPVTTINWGVIGETGVAVKNNVLDYTRSLGLDAITIENVIDSIEYVIQTKPVQKVVADIKWIKVFNAFPKLKANSRFEHVLDIQNHAVENVSEKLNAMNESEKVAYIEKHIVEIISNLLKVPKEKIGRHDSLMNLGLDSLVALEMVASIENVLGQNISLVTLLSTQSISELSQIILAKLFTAPLH